MNKNHFSKAAALTLLFVVTAAVSWELYLRSRHLNIAYDDGKELWAHKRRLADATTPPATVIIGSSRIKYDLDVNTWRKLTGEDAVQLACEGTSPLPALDDLAADESFKGKLVIDVTEGLFFSPVSTRRNDIYGFIEHAKKETPAEKASFALNGVLESQLVFLDRDNYSLNSLLEKLPLKPRDSVFTVPALPAGFGRVTADRQNKMSEEFLSDTTQQNVVKAFWDANRVRNKRPPTHGAELDSFMKAVKMGVDKIKSRGGQVLFVRTPSSGPYWMGEQKAFPREKYWDRLLAYTGAPGIHFADYEPIAHFQCPEFSHLSPQDAIIFTKHFVDYLKERGWRFHGSQSIASSQNPQP
jgi:hypothetical protein